MKLLNYKIDILFEKELLYVGYHTYIRKTSKIRMVSVFLTTPLKKMDKYGRKNKWVVMREALPSDIMFIEETRKRFKAIHDQLKNSIKRSSTL